MRNFVNIIENDDQMFNEIDLERKIREFCENLGFDFQGKSFPVIYQQTERMLTISPTDEIITLEQLERLKVFGDDIKINSSSGNYSMKIEISVFPGLNLYRT